MKTGHDGGAGGRILGPASVTFRRPAEAEYPRLVAAVGAWWGERAARTALPRLWIRHFGGTSWLAESDAGAVVGLLVGFLSPDHADEAVVQLVGTHPSVRRQGLGTSLVDRFLEDVRTVGRRRVVAVVWPGEPASVRFFEALAFVPEDGPGTRRLYGTPATVDYDGPGEDRAVFTRQLGG